MNLRHAFIVSLHFLALGVPVLHAQEDVPESSTTWPDKMCTKGYSKPAFLLATENGFDLHVGSTVEPLEYGGSVGTGLNGAVIKSEKTGKTDVMFSTEMWMDANVQPEVTVPIRIFRDRVFWPCDN